MTPQVVIMRRSESTRAFAYTLDVVDFNGRSAMLIGQDHVVGLSIESQAAIDAYWVNTSTDFKSWVMRLSSGAVISALVDRQDRLIELTALGFRLAQAASLDTLHSQPLLLRDAA